jgi:hypothetical protein
MEKEKLKRIFEFLEEKGENRAPFKWKLFNNIPLTKEDLNVKGDLDLRSIEINSLPEGLKVGGDLDLLFSTISSLPEGLEVNGDLFLDSCKFIKDLPKGLKVGGDIIINRTQLIHYSKDEIKEMIKPGFIKGKIFK